MLFATSFWHFGAVRSTVRITGRVSRDTRRPCVGRDRACHREYDDCSHSGRTPAGNLNGDRIPSSLLAWPRANVCLHDPNRCNLHRRRFDLRLSYQRFPRVQPDLQFRPLSAPLPCIVSGDELSVYASVRDVFNPLTYSIDGLRGVLEGTSRFSPVLDFVVILGFAIVFAVLGAYSFDGGDVV